LIDGTRAMRPLEALLLRLLEPNVYYLEVPYADGVARSKYTVVTWDAFRRGTTPRWFHSYLWGRFSQPTSVLWTRDPDIASAVQVALAEAPITFIRKVLPLLPDRFSAETLWLTGLATSYRTELRSERPDKLRRLYQDEAQHLDQAAAACAELLGYACKPAFESACESACEAACESACESAGEPADATPYRNPLVPGALRRGRLGWRVRMVSGTLLSFLRIVKSAATFEGALDYVAWKLSRQSGRSISIPPQVRAHPWRRAPGFFWRLYREGVFR
ncbi:MAG: hypothetical protein ACKOZX_03735, partial [Gammaproteobacteria bacterium]